VAALRTIFVAGAGIGGLTASLALAGQGFRVVILEKAERLEESGAGLQLSPNASRILIELGLEPRLVQRAVIPEGISLMSARSGREVTRLPLGDAATARAGAPYWLVHRADLQAALQAEVNEHPDIELRLGCQFEDVGTHLKGLTVVQRSGMTRQQDLALALIGADGIWSTVRHHLFPDVQPQFSGLIAWRDRTPISSPIRSRAGARSISSPWCRERGTGRAGARLARSAKSRTRSGRRGGRDRRG
jgi:salicylate hydroxylase